MANDILKTTEEAPLPPVAVTVIGHGAVTGGPTPMETGTVATTPAVNQPNLLVTVISPLAAVGIRFINTYLTVLSGLVAAGMVSDVIPHTDFLALVIRCAGLSVAGAGVGLLKDLVTVFSRLEQKFPLLTGSV